MATQRTTAPNGANGSGPSREAVEALSRARNEPSWMRDFRLAAWARYEELPLPDRSEELWRRTGPELFPVDSVGTAPSAPGSERTSARAPRGLATRLGRSEEERGAVIARREGEPPYVQRDRSLGASGILLMDLGESAHETPEIVRKHFMTAAVKPDAGKFEALHAAFWTSGTLVYAPPGAQAELPLRSITQGAANGSAHLPHLLIVADEGSSVTVVDEQLSYRRNGASLALPVTEVLVGRGAKVQHTAVQESGPGAMSLGITRARVEGDGEFVSHLISLGGRVSKTLVESSLVEPGAHSGIYGLGFGSRSQKFDHFTLQEHLAPNTTSDLLYKSALKDTAESVYLGIIRIVPEANGSAAYQTDRNLLLEGSPKADSIPVLEISADDVSCSHAAAVGPVDPVQVYYLRSRGIERAEAERMLVDAFFREITDALQLPWLGRRLRSTFGRKMQA